MDPVIIAGAGPVGLAMAAALARLGVPVVVLDETDGREEVRLARTAVLRPDTAAFLTRLGCGETLGAEGTRWAAWRTVHRRRVLQRVEFADTGEGYGGGGRPEGEGGGGAGGARARESGRGAPGPTAGAAATTPALPPYSTPSTPSAPSALPALSAGGADGRFTARALSGAAHGDSAHVPLSPVHVPQHALTRALRAILDGDPSAQVVTGSRLDEVEQDGDGVSVRTRGPNGTWWRGSYLIGCDGPRSTVRKLLDVRFPGRTAVERHAVAALRTDLPWPGEALLHRAPPRRGAGAGAGGANAEVTARPLPDGVWRLDWLLPPGRDLVTPDALVARIRDTLAGWADDTGPGGEALVPPYELLDTGVHTVHHRLARRWRCGRAFLAGDAAHLLGALGTQGLDEGLRDAENLAWKLGLAWHHGASEALLDSYQAERRHTIASRLRAADQAVPLLPRARYRWTRHPARRWWTYR